MNEELERIRLADEALALELSGREDNIRKLRTSTVMQTPPSTRKRPRKSSSDAKTTPLAKKINKFFPSNSRLLLFSQFHTAFVSTQFFCYFRSLK